MVSKYTIINCRKIFKRRILVFQTWSNVYITLLYIVSLIILYYPVSGQSYVPNPQEFVGPFSSWVNVKTKYGAKGDGTTDDTQALQKALNEIGIGGENNPQVLYIPPGTYLISAGLTMSNRHYISIIGEDPATTKIKWVGAVEGTMLYLNGVSYSRFTRITWDGSSKANTAIAHKWDGSTGFAVTHNEHADETFMNVGHGIRGGKPHMMDAETSVLRCRFIRNSIAGVSIESFNALDWYIWDSYFEDCRVGVTNDPPTGGAGNFHVFQSIFKRSTYADISMRNTMFFSIRDNYSIGSKAFFVGEPIGQNGGPITLQNNIILDPLDQTPIRFYNKGPITLLDNIVRSREGQIGPVVTSEGDLMTLGNTFTVPNPIFGKEKWITIDDIVQTRNVINPAEPALQATPVKKNRKIFELPAGWVDGIFQKIVDSAAALVGQRPVIHLKPTGFAISKTIVVPSGTDIQFIGDGFHSHISWFGPAGEDVMRLEGADHLVLEEFTIRGNYNQRGIGLTVKHSDQVGKQIFMQGVTVWDGKELGVSMEGFSHTNAELHDFNHRDNPGISVKLIGEGPSTTGRFTIYGGSSSNNMLSYDVDNGGNLMAQDIWYESHYSTGTNTFLNLKGTGTFSLNGAQIFASNTPDVTIAVDNFNGKATFLGVHMNGKFVVKGEGSTTNAVALGNQFNTQGAYSNTSPLAKSAMLNSRIYNNGSYPLDNIGTIDPAFIRNMLEQVRKNRPIYKTSVNGLILHRVQVSQTQIGIRIIPTQTSQNQKPIVTLTTPNQNSSFTAPATISFSASATDPDGKINKVEFFQGNTKLGEDTNGADGWNIIWSKVATGSYSITAVATDNLGAVSISATFKVTVISTPTCTATGTILREYWANIPGVEVSAIPVNTIPTSTSQLSSFEAPTNIGDNYGQRIRGYLCTPISGNYIFYIAGDDNSGLYISTDENPINKQLIASVPRWTLSREWTKYPAQRSVTIYLQAGKKYYIEALHKEREGGDRLAVGWLLPNASTIAVIDSEYLSPYMSSSTRKNDNIIESKNQIKLIIYPNPTPEGKVILNAKGLEKNEDVTISLYNSLGILLYYQIDKSNTIGELKKYLDFSKENFTGVFVLVMESRNKKFIQKVIFTKVL
ncbi:glycosyl hydrolase family 28-related protein [Rhodocytophaga aerolata]|uniref:Glycosyl hydrolase family 28-related protein n=1 Tax=Rhodocytophaga aerolata TaxID=455078 RepID=A0ABT8RCH3_9BACT|nr:glycosyl hydrolase family 28-related protein [Rhodocytophaga aerolata]MDO1449806.1 glycosyl hydrolase family 28-related protein [Rhodocytophaga aerolata]